MGKLIDTILEMIGIKKVPEAPAVALTPQQQVEAAIAANDGVLVNFNTFLSNPSIPILLLPSADEFIHFIDHYEAAYHPTFVFKQNAGNGKFSYYTLNNYFGVKVTV